MKKRKQSKSQLQKRKGRKENRKKYINDAPTPRRGSGNHCSFSK